MTSSEAINRETFRLRLGRWIMGVSLVLSLACFWWAAPSTFFLKAALTGEGPSAASADAAVTPAPVREELLARPEYAAWWATKLCDFTGNSDRTGPLGGEQGLNGQKARQWYAWVERRVRENVPYDDLVGVASGATGNPSILVYSTRMAPTERPDIGYAMIFPSMTIVKVIAVQIVGLLVAAGAG